MSGIGIQTRGSGIARIQRAKGGSAKPGLWANINRRKKLGISRPKSKSTISPEAYRNMQRGFKAAEGGTPAWQRKEGKNPEGGLNKKGIASYRREHPGSHLSLAVTTKPSKLNQVLNLLIDVNHSVVE